MPELVGPGLMLVPHYVSQKPDKVWVQFVSKPAGYVKITIGSITKILINSTKTSRSPTGLKTGKGNLSPKLKAQ